MHTIQFIVILLVVEGFNSITFSNFGTKLKSLRNPSSRVGVIDETVRFDEIIARVVDRSIADKEISNHQSKICCTGGEDLSDYCILLIPGMFCSYVPFYFSEAMSRLNNELNLDCRYIPVHPHSSVGSNAQLLLNSILEIYNETRKSLILVGHSKGGVDASALLALYPEQTLPIVRGLITIQTPYMGSSLIPNTTSIPNITSRYANSSWLHSLLERTPISALQDLTLSSREEFFRLYPLPEQLPILCFSSVTSWGSRQNDGIVSRIETEVPGSRVVRWQAEKSHFFLAQPPLPPIIRNKLQNHREGNSSPSSGDIVEALLRLLLEKCPSTHLRR